MPLLLWDGGSSRVSISLLLLACWIYNCLRGVGKQMFIRFLSLLNLSRNSRLAWRLLKDRRVPLSAKLIVPLGLLYALFPLDLMPDFLIALGQLDDITLLLLSVLLFLKICPPELVREHAEGLAGRTRRQSPEDPKKVIDGEYRIIE